MSDCVFFRSFLIVIPDIRGISAAADFNDLPLFQHIGKGTLDGDLADVGAFCHDLAFRNFARRAFYDLPHPVGLGKRLVCEQLHPGRKLPVTTKL